MDLIVSTHSIFDFFLRFSIFRFEPFDFVASSIQTLDPSLQVIVHVDQGIACLLAGEEAESIFGDDEGGEEWEWSQSWMPGRSTRERRRARRARRGDRSGNID